MYHPLRHSPLYPSSEMEIEAQYHSNPVMMTCDATKKTASLPSSSRVLEGTHVKLCPLNMDLHGESLYHHFGVEERTLWGEGTALASAASQRRRSVHWHLHARGPYPTFESFSNAFKRDVSVPIDSGETNNAADIFFRFQFYVWERKNKIDEEERQHPFVGMGSLFRCDPKNRVIELGHLLFCPVHLQGSTASTEAFYMLFKHCFRDLGYRRVEWKTNALNETSRRAAIRLGFGFEGVFRQHVMYERPPCDKEAAGLTLNRDTVWYGMCDGDWFNFLERGYETYLAQFGVETNTCDTMTKKLMECLLESQKLFQEGGNKP